MINLSETDMTESRWQNEYDQIMTKMNLKQLNMTKIETDKP